MDDERFDRQTRLPGFGGRDGGSESTGDGTDATREAFRLEIKPSARERNGTVEAVADARGEVLAFDSRAAAEAAARRWSERGDVRVAIQARAPQDETEADAYLVANPRRDTREPTDPGADAWRFQTTGNQYGALGQALLTNPGADPPALAYYVRRDLGLEADELDVRLRDGDVATARIDGTTRSWVPDCVVEARRDATDAVLREYWCEIKTGSASFERDQRPVMAAKASAPNVTVLAVRVDLEALPDAYEVRFRAVDP